MLYIVLVLVLAALGLLVSALITASSLWAWVSIALSVLAGLLLVADWLRRRRRSAAPETDEPVAESAAAAEPARETEPDGEPAEAEQTALIPAAGELGDPADTPEPELESAEPEPAAEESAVAESAVAESPVAKSTVAKSSVADEAEPGEEKTPADDVAVLADLEDEVVVVDEHPRYHLTTCTWLGSRERIPIGIGEARQLGFTPCSRCAPDATLVAAHR
ncbi:hypothetical protein [Amycolatopsis solani]|uniref:hypothetical protein n=1 Tax=Amycolatopsis solani TaxID=3028615 RepID=UPI0025B0B177|nr:hypothetical protein [Amycolatopsis sp. MEP2-6]